MSTLQEKAQHLMLGCNAMGWHGSAALVNDLLQQRAELLEALKVAKERIETSAEIIDDVKGECRSVAELYKDQAMPNELYIVINAITRAAAQMQLNKEKK